MKAIALTKFGNASEAFQTVERPIPEPSPTQVLIKVEAFGLNFADVMARRGLYQDAPPLPAVLGYEVVGRVERVGTNVTQVGVGDRVIAFTRFGGYAEYVVAEELAVATIGDQLTAGQATALVTQYCTAYYCAEEMVRLQPGDHVLIQAAAGGVGTALVQLAKLRGCVVYGTAGSDAKIEHIKKQGVDYPINYRTKDFVDEIKRLRGDAGVDVVFDSLGGESFRKGSKILGAGGRIVGFGGSEAIGRGPKWMTMARLGMQFGIIHPAFLMMSCKAVIGVNMLRIGDKKPLVLQRVLRAVIALFDSGKIRPIAEKEYSASDIAKAHEDLEMRRSIGKIAVRWS